MSRDLPQKTHDVFNEEVHGGVAVEFGMESEAIMGGGYLGTVLGPFMRLCGWSDFMACGGWAEADVARIEVGNLMVRSMWNYAHAAGVRSIAAYTFLNGLGPDVNPVTVERGDPRIGDCRPHSVLIVTLPVFPP